MTDFPKLIPAFTIVIEAGSKLDIGISTSGIRNLVVPDTGGTITSEPSFQPTLQGRFEYGADFTKIDASTDCIRLKFRAVYRSSEDDLLYITLSGHIPMTETIKRIFAGEVATTEFGAGYMSGTVHSGSEKYRVLENWIFVGCNRFVQEDGRPPRVEIKMSKVVV